MLGPVFKPVGAGCNMRCDYCFYKNNRRSHEISRMSDNILQKALSQLVEASPEGICFY
jgi:sulfatase maturation enzyme AslB (radical SAM superfamily)